MRWMEALVERAGAAGSLPTIQRLWPVDRRSAPQHDPAYPRGRVNRTLNFVLALLALIASLPVLLIIALLIKLTSRGPVLYTQERVGLDRRMPVDGIQNHRRELDIGGQPFTIYKFRTMRVDAEQDSGAVWAQQQRPPGHPRRPLPAPVPAGRAAPAAQRAQGRDEHRGAPPRAAHHLRRAAGAHRRVPAAPAGQARDHRAGADQPPLRPLARRRAHQGALRPGVHPPPAACAKTCASCSRPSPSSSCAGAAGER